MKGADLREIGGQYAGIAVLEPILETVRESRRICHPVNGFLKDLNPSGGPPQKDPFTGT